MTRPPEGVRIWNSEPACRRASRLPLSLIHICHGFCGACATIYRIKGKNELKTCLACQTQVQEGMYVASIPFFPTDKRTYNLEEIKPKEQIMMELYPEIYSCIGCNACTKACPQKLNVMQYIAYALSLIHI